jgi:hypothetical protein
VRQGFRSEPTGRATTGQVPPGGSGGRPGPLGPGGRGAKRGDDEKEHVNELPQEYNLFGADVKVGPAVIGGDDDR